MIKQLVSSTFKMFSNYRLYSVINFVSLTLSFICVIAISRFIFGEVTVDGFNEDRDRICALLLDHKNNRLEMDGANVGLRELKPILNDPSVEIFTDCIYFDKDGEIILDENRYSVEMIVPDSNFLKVFDYELLMGDKNTVLRSSDKALLSEKMAKRLFPNENPMGKIFKHSDGKELIVEGVVKTPLLKSSLRFDVLISRYLKSEIEWSRTTVAFCKISEGVNIDSLNAKYSEYKWSRPYQRYLKNQFMPISELYFSDVGKIGLMSSGDNANLFILILVGVLVLVVGILNFINIYSVLIIKRNKELSVKKIMGCSSEGLGLQLYIESLVMLFFSVIISWLFVFVLNDVITNSLDIPQQSNGAFDCVLIVFLLVVIPLFITIYPYLKIKYRQPVNSLKGSVTSKKLISSITILMTFQFFITISVIIISIYFIKQLDFMMNSDLGYKTKNVVNVTFFNRTLLSDREKTKATLNSLTEELKNSTIIKKWTRGTSVNNMWSMTSLYRKDASSEPTHLAFSYLTDTYAQIFGLELIEGEWFPDSLYDSYKDKVIINESAKKALDIDDISSVKIEKLQTMFDNYDSQEPGYIPTTIIGVAKDFQVGHLKNNVQPRMFACSYFFDFDVFIIELYEGREEEGMAYIKSLYDKYIGGDFDYSYVEDEVKAQYVEDKRVTRVYTIFAVIAIIISSIGLFGLSLFDVTTRTKEIALRKINGATILNIITLIMRRYAAILTVGFVLSSVVSVSLIRQYTLSFAHKAPISTSIFVIAALITIVISFSTLIIQILRASRMNPVDGIRKD